MSSFFAKVFKSPDSPSGSPKTAKKSASKSDSQKSSRYTKERVKTPFKTSEKRTKSKSQPIQSLHVSKSYAKTKSHDPDVSLGLTSKMSSMSIGSDEEFHDALDSTDEFPVELPKLASQYSVTQPLQDELGKKQAYGSGWTYDEPQTETLNPFKLNQSPDRPKKTLPARKVKKSRTVPSKMVASDEEENERSYSPQAYGKTQAPPSKKGTFKLGSPAVRIKKMSSEMDESDEEANERSNSPQAYSKTRAPLSKKGTSKKEPISKMGSKSKLAGSSPLTDSKKSPLPPPAPPPPAYSETLQDEPPPPPAPPIIISKKVSKSKAGFSLKSSPFHKGDNIELPPSYSKASGATSDIQDEGKPPPSYSQAVPMKEDDGSGASGAAPPQAPPSPPILTFQGSDSAAKDQNRSPRYPTETAGGIATDLHFQIVAEELSPSDLPALCRYIGLSTAKVEQIQYDKMHLPFQEHVIAILQEWRKKAGRDVTLRALLQALANSGNVMAANTIEDRLQLKGYVQQQVKDPSPIPEEKQRGRDYHAVDKFKQTMSELTSSHKVNKKESTQSDTELKYFCPKCDQGYSNVTLLHLHVDQCIEHLATRNKLKIQTSVEAVDELESYVDPKSSHVNAFKRHVSIIDDGTITEVASECGEGDWQKLAYRLGFLEHAIKRFEVRQSSHTPVQHAEHVLRDWRRRQKKQTDMVLKLTDALKKCHGHPHLVKLGTKIITEYQTGERPHLKTALSEDFKPLNPPSTLDDDTLKQLAHQLGSEWKKLAVHLGFSPGVIDRLDNRSPDYKSQDSQEKALYMLKVWIGKQKKGCDVVGIIARKLSKCGERHLAELAEWLRKQQASTASGGKTPELPSGLLSPETPQGMGSEGSHIMISYQWDSQKLALKLKQQLSEAGYNVWIDVDKMGGDLLGSMANAVENAAVVLLCVSQKYKNSNNCRGEASYAFQSKKPIIPVLMEKGYEPDGWLGMVISMRLYYEMYNEKVMKTNLPSLINDIGDRGRTYKHSISFSARATPIAIDSYKLLHNCKAYVYLCDPEHELLPYADIWVTMFLNPSLRVFKDDVSQQLLKQGGEALHKSMKAMYGTNAIPLKVGTVLQSTPGNLPCQKAFHVIYKENTHSSGYIVELKSAFTECLWLAEHRGAVSVAFSLFTNQELFEFNSVVEELINTVVVELKKRGKESILKRVLFVTQKTSLTKKISGKLYNFLENQPTQGRTKVYGKTKLANDTTITLLNGDLFEATTDAIVLSVSSSLQRIGLCASAFVQGGEALQDTFNKYAEKNRHRQLSGQAFRVDSGNLPCGNVIFAVVPPSSTPTKMNKEQMLKDALTNSLKIADDNNCRSVAVPLLGFNYMLVSPQQAACNLVEATLKYFELNPSSSIKELWFLDAQTRCVESLKEELVARVGFANIQEDSADGSDMETELATEIEIEETPAEILARGPAAHQAYLEASRDGTKPVYRTRLMLVGQERVGKTSLMKSLSGQRFDATETITDGVDATSLCEIPTDIGKPWTLQDSAIKDLANYVQSQYMEALCTLMAQRLTELGEREHHVDSADEEQEKEELMELLSQMKELQVQEEQRDETSKSGATPIAEVDADDLEVDSEPMSEEETSVMEEHAMDEVDAEVVHDDQQQEDKPDVSVPDAILQKLKQVLRDKKEELQEAEAKKGVQQFQIWDFAGQDVYYTTHQVFLSNRALYMVIFDLRTDLNKPVKVEVFHNDKVQSRFHDFTGFGFLNFWMQSIYAYATNKSTAPPEDRPQLSPPIFIIGTHRDSNDISQDPEERKQIVSDKFENIANMIAGKPYEQHVVSRYYAIENSADDQTDDELIQLRHHLVSIASQESYMGEKIPLRWLTFEKSVAEAITKSQHYMNLSEVQDLASELGVSGNAELFTMLHFYHDLGTIIYFGGDDCPNSYLQDMVILDPQWLIDVFKKIITVMPHQKQWATHGHMWRRLKNVGIIDNSLIDHMWNNLLPQKPALLAIMEMFDLLCRRLGAEEASDTYYVPACLQPCSEEDVRQELGNGDKSVSFYIDFEGFLPDGLFHRLLVHAARWSQHQSGEEPQLYFRYGSFTLDEEHTFQLEMKGADQVCIKVTVCKMRVFSPDGVHDNSSIDEEPDPKACSTIRTFLDHALNELTFTWIQGIRYRFTVACPCNDLQQMTPDPNVPTCQLHLLHLEDCLSKPKIKCKGKKMWIATSIFQKWFQEKVEEEQDEIALLKQASKTLSDVELLELSGEIGMAWRKLGLLLGLGACYIAALNRDSSDAEDKAFNMLIEWHKGLAEHSNARLVLCKALRKCKLDSLAESYKNPKDVQ